MSADLKIISKRRIFKGGFQTQTTWKLSSSPHVVATVLSGALLEISLPFLKFADKRFFPPASSLR